MTFPNKIKPFVTLLLSAVLAFSLAACQTSGTAGSSAASSEPAPPAVTSSEKAEASEPASSELASSAVPSEPAPSEPASSESASSEAPSEPASKETPSSRAESKATAPKAETPSSQAQAAPRLQSTPPAVASSEPASVSSEPTPSSDPTPSSEPASSEETAPVEPIIPSCGGDEGEVEQLLFEKINDKRIELGLPALKWSDAAHTAASIRCNELPFLYEHERPDGRKWNTVFAEVGIKNAPTRENLIYAGNGALVYDVDQTVEAFFKGWIESPDHYENIIATDVNAAGLCVIYDGPDIYATQEFCKE